jgi:tetratricopeptide (TPR) repeat protein
MPELDAIASYNRLAQRARSQGAPEQALLFLANALRLARECGLPLLEARARHAMGLVYARIGRDDLAACCCRTALGLLEASGAHPKNQYMARAISTSLARIQQA